MHNENTDTPKQELASVETPPLVYPFPPPKPPRKKLLPKEVRDEQQKLAGPPSGKLAGATDPTSSSKTVCKEDLKFLEVKRDVLKFKQELLNQSLVLNSAAICRPILNESLSKNAAPKPGPLVGQAVAANGMVNTDDKPPAEQLLESTVDSHKNPAVVVGHQSQQVLETISINNSVPQNQIQDIRSPPDNKTEGRLNFEKREQIFNAVNRSPKCNNCYQSTETDDSTDSCRCEQDISLDVNKCNRNSETRKRTPKGILMNKQTNDSSLRTGGSGKGGGKRAPVVNDSSELTNETSVEWDACSPTSPQCTKKLLNNNNQNNNNSNHNNKSTKNNSNNIRHASKQHHCSDTVTTRRSPRKKRSKTPPPEKTNQKSCRSPGSKSNRSVKLRLGSPKHNHTSTYNDTTEESKCTTHSSRNSSRNTTINHQNNTEDFLSDYNSRLINKGKTSLRTKSDKLDTQAWMYDMICCQNYSSAALYLGLVVFLIGIIFVAFKLYLTFVLPRDKNPASTQNQHIKHHHWDNPNPMQKIPDEYNNHLRNQLHGLEGIDDINPQQNFSKIDEFFRYHPTLQYHVHMKGGNQGGGQLTSTRRVHTLADVIVKKNFVPTATTASSRTKPGNKHKLPLTLNIGNDKTSSGRVKNMDEHAKQNDGNSGTTQNRSRQNLSTSSNMNNNMNEINNSSNTKDSDRNNNNKNKYNNNYNGFRNYPASYDPDPMGTGFFTTRATPIVPSTSAPYVNPYANPYSNPYSNLRNNPYTNTAQQSQDSKESSWQWDGMKWIWKPMQMMQTTPKPPENMNSGIGVVSGYNQPPGGYYKSMYYTTTTTTTTTTPPPTTPQVTTPVINLQPTNAYQRWWQQYNGQQQQQVNPNPLYSRPTGARYSASGQPWYHNNNDNNIDNNNNDNNGKLQGYGGWSYPGMGGYNPDTSNIPTYPYMYRTTSGPISEKDVDSLTEYNNKLQEHLSGYIEQLKNEGLPSENNDNVDSEDDGGSGISSGNGDQEDAEQHPVKKKHKKHKKKKTKKRKKSKKKWKTKAKHTTTSSKRTTLAKKTTTTSTTHKPTTTTTKRTTKAPKTTPPPTTKHKRTTPRRSTPRKTTHRKTTHRRTTTTEITFSFTNALTTPSGPPPPMALGGRDDRRDDYDIQEFGNYSPGEGNDDERTSFSHSDRVDERPDDSGVPQEGERVHVEHFPGERFGDDVTRFGSDTTQSPQDESDSILTERSEIPTRKSKNEFRFPPEYKHDSYGTHGELHKTPSTKHSHKRHHHRPTHSHTRDGGGNDNDNDESGNDEVDKQDSDSRRNSNGDDDDSTTQDEGEEEDKAVKKKRKTRHKHSKTTKKHINQASLDNTDNSDNDDDLDVDLMKVSKEHPSAKAHQTANHHHHHHQTYLEAIRQLHHKHNNHKPTHHKSPQTHHKHIKAKPSDAQHRLELLAAIQRRIQTLQSIQKMRETRQRKGDTSFLEKVGRTESEVKHVKDSCTNIKSFPSGTVVSMGKHPIQKEGKMVYSVRACQKVLVEDDAGLNEEQDVRLKCKDIEYKISGGALTVHTRGHGKKKIYSVQACRDHRNV